MLLDQARDPNQVSIAQWLKRTQKQDTQNSIFVFSTSISASPRRVYYFYLQALQFLADVSDQSINIAALPSAYELDLARPGSYSFRIDLAKHLLGVELSFESNPLEFIASADMSTVAVVGVLAAIAIPAYNDYILRAKIAGALSQAEHFKLAVSEYYLTHQRWPDADALKTSPFNVQNQATQEAKGVRVYAEAHTGNVVIRFTSGQLNGTEIRLRPVMQGKEIRVWRCKSTMPYRLTPPICRQ